MSPLYYDTTHKSCHSWSLFRILPYGHQSGGESHRNWCKTDAKRLAASTCTKSWIKNYLIIVWVPEAAHSKALEIPRRMNKFRKHFVENFFQKIILKFHKIFRFSRFFLHGSFENFQNLKISDFRFSQKSWRKNLENWKFLWNFKIVFWKKFSTKYFRNLFIRRVISRPFECAASGTQTIIRWFFIQLLVQVLAASRFASVLHQLLWDCPPDWWPCDRIRKSDHEWTDLCVVL